MNKKTNLIWIDLEMTGLSPENDVIIEIATVVTDADLNIIDEGPSLVIHQDNNYLDGMDEWNTNQHNSSGLVQSLRVTNVTIEDAERETLKFLSNHTIKGRSPLCGNTISHDRRFLARYMPELSSFFHYRNVDVSSIKEVVKRWYPHLADGYKKQGGHRAMADVIDSIHELKYFKNNVFISGS